ncbi:MAG: two-component sensor histidine kinase [Desulfamplus sp.]|nr:two-component sensor histidine kinase [Desulfamplus sp.]MBF0257957.1 two-component sensor histidine kinase [Desulfamplus sp.]
MSIYNNSKEQKPFRLVKFFTFSALMVMFAATIVISAMNAHWVRNILQEKSEDYAHLLVANLNHQVFLQFIIPAVLKYGKIKLREESQYQRMDRVIKTTLHGFNVDIVNIYDMNNTIAYSFDPEKKGVKDAGGTGYAMALNNKATSILIEKGNVVEMFFGVPHQTKIVTFAPLRAEKPLSSISGPVLGVVEITQDISDDYHKIFKLQLLTVATCFCVMAVLFFILVFVVRRGEMIIETRAMERLKLEDKLQRAEHLSAIGEMTAGISHEIRNPLGIIKSSAELLKKKMTKSDQPTTIIDIIVEESIRLNNIIKDFLDFAKPMTPLLKPCRIDEVIEKNIHYLYQQIKENDFVIAKDFTQPIPEIMADAEKLYQAFLNIMLNAFQAMPREGKLSIVLFVENEDIIILFHDQGKGIPEESLKKIWNPFFTTKEMGTGLGMGIVKNIIESHHGKIEIYNRDSGGVTVKIALPSKEKY